MKGKGGGGGEGWDCRQRDHRNSNGRREIEKLVGQERNHRGHNVHTSESSLLQQLTPRPHAPLFHIPHPLNLLERAITSYRSHVDRSRPILVYSSSISSLSFSLKCELIVPVTGTGFDLCKIEGMEGPFTVRQLRLPILSPTGEALWTPSESILMALAEIRLGRLIRAANPKDIHPPNPSDCDRRVNDTTEGGLVGKERR